MSFKVKGAVPEVKQVRVYANAPAHVLTVDQFAQWVADVSRDNSVVSVDTERRRVLLAVVDPKESPDA